MYEMKGIDVMFLNKFIMGFPKLQFVDHMLMVSVLAELTDEEAQTGLNSFHSLDQLVVRSLLDDSNNLRYDILQKAPKFAVTCNISRASVYAKGHTHLPSAELLMPLAKLNSIILDNLSNCHKEGLLKVLESKGHQLKDLHLFGVFEFVSLRDIIRTCTSLRNITLNYDVSSDFDDDSGKNQEKQIVEPIDLPSLSNLESIRLSYLNEQMCPSEMLNALLVTPSLNDVKLTAIETLFIDSMLNLLLCSPLGSLALTSVKDFQVKKCPNITAAPFVRLLSMEDTKLDELHIEDCDMVDEDVFHEALKIYPRPLDIMASSSTKENSKET